MQPTEANARGVDVFVLLGWPQATDLIQRRVGATSFVVCASPSYWNAHGIPRHPSELEQHNCLTVRAINGTLMDVWRFQRGDERVSVTARGWLLADNAQRDVVRRTVLAGGGVARVPDWLKRRGQDLATGRLVAALTDWEQPDVAPISVLYQPGVRRVPRVRAFIAFVTQLFRNIEEQRENRSAASTREPEWLRTHYPRASLAPGS